jgi:lysophospholipase L1-like esterase
MSESDQIKNKSIKRRMQLLIAIFVAIYACSLSARAQPVDFTYPAYGLEVDEDNVIQNVLHLQRFYEHLYQLNSHGSRKVNIIHIGDSHIQADYLTSVVRRNFHRHFGNAGRGLVVPLQVAGSNGPANFKTASNIPWKSKRCVFPNQPLPIGIGGVTIQTTNANANLEIHMHDLWLDYTFNSLTLFYEKDEKSYDFSVRSSEGVELAVIHSSSQPFTRNFSKVTWEKGVGAVTIQSVKAAPEQSQAVLYGAVLENCSNGVLYHAIGVNGAKARHYNEATYFAEQTGALGANLFVISLGTNESADYPYIDKNFGNHLDQLVSSLKIHNPDADFVLVTPQEVFRRRNKSNPGIAQVREEIIRYAVEHGLAFYDMYRALGGEHSAINWRASGLLSPDGIHLTKDGYEYQGNLFFHALMKGYNLYVPARHP